MNALHDFIRDHAVWGPCCCGRCIDAPANPNNCQPTGHTADLVFFKVAAKPGTDAAELVRLVSEHKKGIYGDAEIFDGVEHNYLELGSWIGDQGIALRLMGLGAVLGIWKLLTPRIVFGNLITEELVQNMARQGWVSIQAEPRRI